MPENIPQLNIILLIVAGLFCTLLPVAVLIIWKLKNKSSRLICALAGAATFVVWALVLEQMLHMVMLPVVQGSTLAYTVYGALAAGLFEETGRFVTFKLFLRKTTQEGKPENAVMFGIGHGGIESILIIGVNMISFAAMAIMINAGQSELIFGGLDDATKQIAIGQIESFTLAEPLWYVLVSFERLGAVAVHIAFSVFVFAAASRKGKLWMYPAAVVGHALVDVFAALYQRGVVPLIVCEIWLAVCVAVLGFLAVRVYKSMKKEQMA